MWYLKKMVSGRAARFPIGLNTAIPFVRAIPEHKKRGRLAIICHE
jgi:hypothetical protein